MIFNSGYKQIRCTKLMMWSPRSAWQLSNWGVDAVPNTKQLWVLGTFFLLKNCLFWPKDRPKQTSKAVCCAGQTIEQKAPQPSQSVGYTENGLFLLILPTCPPHSDGNPLPWSTHYPGAPVSSWVSGRQRWGRVSHREWVGFLFNVSLSVHSTQKSTDSYSSERGEALWPKSPEKDPERRRLWGNHSQGDCRRIFNVGKEHHYAELGHNTPREA